MTNQDRFKQMAAENNYSMHSAKNAIQQSQQQRKEAFTKFFPSVSASGVALTFNKHLVDVNLNIPSSITQMLPPDVILPNNLQMIKNGVYGSASAVQPVFMGGLFFM